MTCKGIIMQMCSPANGSQVQVCVCVCVCVCACMCVCVCVCVCGCVCGVGVGVGGCGCGWVWVCGCLTVTISSFNWYQRLVQNVGSPPGCSGSMSKYGHLDPVYTHWPPHPDKGSFQPCPQVLWLSETFSMCLLHMHISGGDSSLTYRKWYVHTYIRESVREHQFHLQFSWSSSSATHSRTQGDRCQEGKLNSLSSW